MKETGWKAPYSHPQASVYHRPAQTFMTRSRHVVQRLEDLQAERTREEEEETAPQDSSLEPGAAAGAGPGAGSSGGTGGVDLLGVLDEAPPSAPAQAAAPAHVGGGTGSLEDLVSVRSRLGRTLSAPAWRRDVTGRRLMKKVVEKHVPSVPRWLPSHSQLWDACALTGAGPA